MVATSRGKPRVSCVAGVSAGSGGFDPPSRFILPAALTPYYDLVPKDLAANLRFREEMLLLAGRDRGAQAQLLDMCSKDMLFYINTFCWTYSPKDNPGHPVTPFITYEFQDESMLESYKSITMGRDEARPKSRGTGASWMGLTVFEWFWHFREYMSFLLLSRKQDLVDKRGDPKALFWKIDFLHKHQPKWLLPANRWLGNKDPGRKEMHLENADTGSVIDGESTTDNLAVGDRRSAMLVDEFGPFGADGYAVLTGTRDVTNCRMFYSTPRGQNAFYDVCTKLDAHVMYLHWSRHPVFARGLYSTDERTGGVVLLDDWRGMVEVKGDNGKRKNVLFPDNYPFVLDAKHKMTTLPGYHGPLLRSPWYDRQCRRCANSREISQELDIDFIGSDYPFFDPEFVGVLRAKYCRPPLLRGDLEFDSETLEPKRFVESKHGLLDLWMTLGHGGRPAKDRRFVVGSDISAGTGASNSVSSGVDRHTGEKIAALRTPILRPTGFSKYTMALAKWLNGALMIWDASGPTGKVFTQNVISEHYSNIYYRRYEKKVTQKISDEPGYYLNPTARESLLEDYRADLADHKFVNRSDQGMAECLQFIRKPDGTIEHSASTNAQDPSGARTAHGDEVIADALAALGCRDYHRKEKAEAPAVPEGSLAWRMKRKTQMATAGASDELGEGWR